MSAEKREVVDCEVMPKGMAVCIQQAGLEENSVVQLKAAFLGMFANAERWVAEAKAIVVSDVNQVREMKAARDMRLTLRSIRCDAESARKRLKEDSLRKGKAIDGIANVLKALIEPVEEYLLKQEQFAVIAEAKAKALVMEARQTAAWPFVLALTESGIPFTADFSNLTDDQFVVYLEGLKQQCASREADKKRRAEEAIAAEVAAREERERLLKELEASRLAKIESEAKAAAEKEVARLAAEKRFAEMQAAQAEVLAKVRLENEREAARIAAQAEVARKRVEQEAALLRARLEVEEKARAQQEAAEADQKRLVDEAAAVALRASQAPDKEKVLAFSEAVSSLVVPSFASVAGKALEKKFGDAVVRFRAWVVKRGNEVL